MNLDPQDILSGQLCTTYRMCYQDSHVQPIRCAIRKDTLLGHT
ncbi:hypothetical protein GBAR_LOCUS20533 [Geodia barretti]|uniref:Uncharacterized protein n=1 Tax=Geodia barretti TaxID=519541 RepID=A0AA35WXP0_GEOBA|nr:hypothetical protein GBAR_LOCUS20533 [Geodia barretti]